MSERLRGWFWWWRFELEGLFSPLRLHYRKCKECASLQGHGYSGPERRIYQQCCRCGKFRVFGKFVEMYGEEIGGGWRYECVECALAEMTQLVESRP